MYPRKMHLIEDHAEAAEIPIRFAASKLIEGDSLVEDKLKLSQNEKEMIEHIIVQWKMKVEWIDFQPLQKCVLHL